MTKMGRVHPSGWKERQRHFCCWKWCAPKSPWQLEQVLIADPTLVSENTLQLPLQCKGLTYKEHCFVACSFAFSDYISSLVSVAKFVAFYKTRGALGWVSWSTWSSQRVSYSGHFLLSCCCSAQTTFELGPQTFTLNQRQSLPLRTDSFTQSCVEFELEVAGWQGSKCQLQQRSTSWDGLLLHH